MSQYWARIWHDEDTRCCRIDIGLIVFAALVIVGAGLGLRDPWPADEPRFTVIARDMVISGEWFFPRIGGVYYADKPPLYFWILAGFVSLTDSVRGAFLLPSLFASIAVLVLVYDLGRRLWHRGVGVLASLLLLLTFQFTNLAKVAQIDMLLCFWVTVALYGFIRHLQTGPSWGWYYLGFCFAGLGVITKGVGFLALFVFVPYGLAVLLRMEVVKPGWSWRWLIGPALFFAVIAAWVVPMLFHVNQSDDAAMQVYRDHILFKQTGERYLQAWDHRQPSWYFFTHVIPFLWLPISLLLPWLLPLWIKAIQQRESRCFLLFGWIVCALVFFTAASGKRGVYLLPLLPAVALITAPYLGQLLRRTGVKRLLCFGLWFTGLACLGTVGYFLLLNPDAGVALVDRYRIEPWWPLGCVAVIALAASVITGVRHSLVGWGIFLCGFWLTYSLWIAPRVNEIRSGSAFISEVNRLIGEEAELALVSWKEQFLLYLDRPIVHFGFRRWKEKPLILPNGLAVRSETLEAVHWLTQRQNRLLLIPGDALHLCFDRHAIVSAGYAHRQHWFLAGPDSVGPHCNRKPQTKTQKTFYYDRGRIGESQLSNERAKADVMPDIARWND